MTKEEFKYLNITNRWGGKEVCTDFDEKIDKWIAQFEEGERDVILALLMHFEYYTNRKLNKRVVELYRKFIDTYIVDIDHQTMVFIPPYKEYGVGFSDVFFSTFWTMNCLYDYTEKNVYSLLQEGNQFEIIVVVDDYSGTGKTICSTINKCIEANASCKRTLFYVLTTVISRMAEEKIQKFARENELRITTLALDKSDKVFVENNYFDKNKAEALMRCYEEISKRCSVDKDYVFGYQQTQALIAFEYNTPNNTLGLFWHEKESFFSLFRRHKKKNTSLSEMQKDARRRKLQRKERVLKRHEESENYSLLMAYLVNKDKDFNYGQAREEFGMTGDQLDEALNYLMVEKYVEVKNGKFRPTKLLKEQIKVTKINVLDNMDSYEDPVAFSEKKYVPIGFENNFTGYKTE